ncbi:MAG: phage tail tape measure protein, partial [Desulfobulbales bacterium]
ISTGQRPLTPGVDIESQLGGRATQLTLADELQKKIIAQAVAERQVTLEIQAQTQAREAQKLAFAQQPGLGQVYGRMRAAAEPVAPPVMTPEQIRVDQDARYEALKQEAITPKPRPQIFDPAQEQRLGWEQNILKVQEAQGAAMDKAIKKEQLQAVEAQKLLELEKMIASVRAEAAKPGPDTYKGRIAAAREAGRISTGDVPVIDTAQQKRDDLRAQGEAEKRLREPMTRPQILETFAKQIPGGQTGMDNLNAQLEKFGVTSARVTSVTQEMSNGITSMSLAMDKDNNVVARGTVHMDQYGNVLQDTSRRFKSFSDAVGTNIIKVTQWAVATGLVYGAVRQVGQVFKEITEIQSKLASVQIALGASQGDLNAVFEEALKVANLTSSSVAGVVEAYAIAYRATGSYSTEVERVAVANSILQESMILAKLAGVDQATAMDTLVGALRQTGMELDQGRDLLDKWVHVSRQANVSLDTLAQTYAIVGSTAQGVGIEMEELNAIAATLAEATGLSATETGNAVRGIVAGFQSASSEKTLARFGIATRDATGQLRDFMGLYQELAILTQSGILSERDISEIANAIGGGYRRGAQVQTLLMNSSRVAQITAGQSEAGGAAAEALGIQMATLESAITRLGNAFTKFAQTLGSEGGFLTVITSIVDAMSGLLNMVTSLAGGLGKATPALVAFVAAWTVLGSTRGQDMFKGIINKPLGGMLTQGLGAIGIGRPLAEQQMMDARAGGYYAMQRPPQMTVGGAFTGARTGLAGKMGGLDPMALVAPILIAGSAFMSAAKMKEEDPTGAGLEAGRGVTSIIGAI